MYGVLAGKLLTANLHGRDRHELPHLAYSIIGWLTNQNRRLRAAATCKLYAIRTEYVDYCELWWREPILSPSPTTRQLARLVINP